jgi:hypothetical protein
MSRYAFPQIGYLVMLQVRFLQSIIQEMFKNLFPSLTSQEINEVQESLLLEQPEIAMVTEFLIILNIKREQTPMTLSLSKIAIKEEFLIT